MSGDSDFDFDNDLKQGLLLGAAWLLSEWMRFCYATIRWTHENEQVAEEVWADGGGVLWVNDSKATNIGSTDVALRSMDRPVVLLLGGRHKGEPYSGLLDAMRGRVRRVIAFGEAEQRIADDLAGHVDVDRVAGTFDTVVAHAARIAEPGDAILLSPACASFDMFRDYEDRGRTFRELALQHAAAEVRA